MPYQRLLLFFIGVLLSITGSAQQYAYQVSFADKKGSLSITNPSAFLSARALNRRATQGIAIDSTDVPVSPIYIDSVLTITGGVFHETSKWLNMCVVLVRDTNAIAPLRTLPYITDVRLVGCYTHGLHNKVPHPSANTSQPQMLLAKTTGNSWEYGQAYTQTLLVNGDYLHDNGYKGEGELIAVIDAGFQEADTHPGFDSVRMAGGFVDTHNFVLDTGFVFGYSPHGLGSLSTMAGNMPGGVGSDTGYIGSAPHAQYALYIAQDDNEEPLLLDNLVAATERADSVGADVISVSLGFDLFEGTANDPDCFFPGFNFSTDFDGKSTIAARAANMATKKGMLYVASAGNEGTGVPGWGNYILTPGDADSAITVGAVSMNGTSAAFSGYGPNAAGQVKPDVCLLGVSAAMFYPGGIIGKQDGTSFSTPQLAGWAACLWQAAGNSTSPYTIRKLISQSADHHSNPGPQIGYGVPDFRKALQQALGVSELHNTPTTQTWVLAENPFSNAIHLIVKAPFKSDVDFILTDLSGKKIFSSTQTFYQEQATHVSLQIPGSLSSGVYILHVVSAGQQQVLKMVKE
ncbi:MAG: S8 family peptidase [Flavipsychrobacter sp.]|nr:S8 family peptidase [Flavipsychrobacter sp.]